jgi:hypothetical protein
MATDNRGVMVYLPSELEAKIAEYCTEHNITRKDKQGNIVTSLGSGIVAYLKSQLLGDLPRTISDRPINGLTREEVLDLIAESNISNIPIDRSTESLDSAAINRLETIEHKLSSSTGMERDEVELLIQSSEQRVMDAVRSMLTELRGEVAEVKDIDHSPAERLRQRVNTPPIEILTTGTEKPIEDTGKLPMSRDITRWFGYLEDEKFKGIVQTGISDKHSNQEIVTRLFAAGYGKKENTEPYTANLASAMKTALKIQDQRS